MFTMRHLLVFCAISTCILSGIAPYPFETKTITVPSTTADPFLLQFHHTRYSGKCFEPMTHNYSYNTIVPFIQNFDLLVTTCNMVWDNPFASRTAGSCVFVLNGRSTTNHTVERVHVQTDHRHHQYFVEHVLPFYVKRYNETGAGIILHTGGNDAPTRPEMITIFLNTAAILRWVPEQSTSQQLVNHPKVMFLPTGICARENVGHQGANLRIALAESVPALSTISKVVAPAQQSLSRGVNASTIKSELISQENITIHHPHTHRMLQETAKTHGKSWNERLDRVLLCFGEKNNKHRIKFMNYARAGNCTVCDYCNHTMPAIDLWRMYGRYKFVLSPYGNGADCGRSWEIMIMGAVPVIEYFSGALGYEQGGLTIVTVVKPEELTQHNVSQWKKKYPHGQVVEKLSMEYWRDRIFNEENLGSISPQSEVLDVLQPRTIKDLQNN